ncbi:MAG TPA: deoxyribose-phosphate aldolase, partial [Chloroflexi bacterium]|nr:deoxyribose-phosphate aldolase [Chloroflexota bacterium]
ASTTIGFPHGGHTTAIKAAEARQALADGGQELDMVVNISAVLGGDWDYVRRDIAAVLEPTHAAGQKIKVIIENAYLNDAQKIRLCEICGELRADWVKTSTGYAPSGATIADLKLMRAHAPAHVQVKAAGGVRDLDKLLEVRAIGATRCGATRTREMLDEARRRSGRGTDVVVGAVSGGGAAQLGSLALLGGPSSPAARGVLDVEALLTRNPDVVAIDDLIGLTTTGQLVGHMLPRIRAAGITAIGTVHIGDLRSTVALMGTLLNRPQDRPILDDSAVDAADEVELVDVPPAELEERLRQGEIMPPVEALQALQGEFRPEVLAALRETALRRVAEHCDRQLVAYMSTARIQEPWEARPRVLVLVPPRPGQEPVIRRAAAHAIRKDDALTAVSVRRRSRSEEEKRLIGSYATLTHQLGGEFVTIDGSDVATTVADYARGHRITEILVMRSTRNSSSKTLRKLIRLVANVDVHVVAATD